MKKVVLALIAFITAGGAVLAGAPAAHASPACLGTPSGPVCDWVRNGNFSQGERYWNFQNGAVVMPISDACPARGPYVAELQQATSISQQMSIETGYGSKFRVEFDLYLRNDQENFWDAFNVIVRDLTTGSVEKKQYVGSNFNSRCDMSFDLSRNYSGHTVELQFTTNTYGMIGYFQIDDIFFLSLP